MVARIIESCARHRGLVVVVTALAVVGAVFAMGRVPLDAIPDLSDPQVIVFTEWMGRSPDLIEDQVTYPIVASLLGAPRVHEVRGQSMFGMSFVYVIFDDGTDPYWARSRVLEYLSTLRSRLPDGVEPALGPDATSLGWVFQYALDDRSGRHDLSELRAFQDFNLRYALSSVEGVAEVATVGGFERQYQVEVDPARLHAFGLSLRDIAGAIRRSNADVGGRVLEMSGREYFVRGRGYVRDLEDLRRVAIGRDPRSGTPVRVGDVARVAFGPDIRRGTADLDGEGESVGGIVIMRHGENALQVIERVRARLAELRPSFPPGVTLRVVYDRSSLIHQAIETLRTTLIEQMIIVSLVIFVFLLHVRSTLIPVLALPVSVALAFVPMWLFRINSNIMSLGGLAIAIGEIADAAIVLVENAHKRLEEAPPGADRTRLLIEAAQEVGTPVFYSLLVVTVAFLPIFALTGQAGRLFTPLAWTKTFAMGFAAVVSITLAPALLSALVRGRIRPEPEHPVSRAFIGLYRPFAWVAFRNPRVTVAIGIAAVLSAAPMAARLGSEFMPPLNEGDLLYMPTTFPNVSIEEARRSLQAQDRRIREVPEVERVFGKAGRAETATDPAPLSMVETVVKLRPRDEWRMVRDDRWWSGRAPEWLGPALRVAWPDRRRISWDELIAELDARAALPGWTGAWTMPIKTRIDMLSTGIRTPVGVKVYGADLDTIERIGMDIERVVSQVPATRSVYSDRNTGGYYVDIVPDRDAIARYGLTVGDVQDVIEAAVGGQTVAWTVEGRARFSVNVRYPRELREDLGRLRRVLVPIRRDGAPSGGGGPMGAFAPADGAVAPAPVLLAAAGVADWEDLDAQGMGGGMGGGGAGSKPAPGGATPATGMGAGRAAPRGPSAGGPAGPASGSPAGLGAWQGGGQAHIPLGQIADVRVVEGPPMIRDDDGMLAGYVYVDLDASRRDVGSYVEEARRAVQREVRLPSGYSLRWTGQYELLLDMQRRMGVLVPVTLVLIVFLLYLNFGRLAPVLIVMASVPFSLVGSVWLMAALGYNLSTATWVGLIALVGLAAQTGVLMIVYLDASYERWKAAGRLRTYADVVEATLEGAVQRVRPKLMTVATTLIGLLPLMWADGAGADVMKRLAAPIIGGLFTSTFLTLEIIPVVYSWWRHAELVREQRAAGAA
jgi:Cu(I)/Ag(I) efflux system membrane protein CusA/SilA